MAKQKTLPLIKPCNKPTCFVLTGTTKAQTSPCMCSQISVLAVFQLDHIITLILISLVSIARISLLLLSSSTDHVDTCLTKERFSHNEAHLKMKLKENIIKRSHFQTQEMQPTTRFPYMSSYNVIPIQGVQHKMVLVVNFLKNLKLNWIAFLLLYLT